MKRNLIIGILFIGAAALSSCYTANKMASQTTNDDVYYSRATAGDGPEYVPTVASQPEDSYADDDYYYYGDYAARINRFDYYSPFDYCDGFYGYSPYNRFGFGLSLGFGYNYSPYGYGYSPYGYGYSPYYGGYNYYGVGYGGYGGYYYGGSLAGNNPRPYRGSGSPGTPVTYRGQRIGLASAATSRIGYYPGRPGNRGVGVNAAGGSANGRPSRTSIDNSRPQQVSSERYQPPSNSNNNSGRSSSSSSSSGSSSSGGGGGRPVRP
jgi:hypothetical protein